MRLQSLAVCAVRLFSARLARALLFGSLLGLVGCEVCCETIQATNRRLAAAKEKLKVNPADTEALDEILNELKGGCDIVGRGNAASALGGAFENPNSAVPDAAIAALAEALNGGEQEVMTGAAKSVETIGERAAAAIPALRRSVHFGGNTDTAWFSAQALGAMGDLAAEAVPDLVDVIKAQKGPYREHGPDIREDAVEALGDIGPAAREAVPDLADLLATDDPYYRSHLAVALIRIDPGNQQALAALDALADHPELRVREQVLFALVKAQEEARPAVQVIRKLTADPEESLRKSAADLLTLFEPGSGTVVRRR